MGRTRSSGGNRRETDHVLFNSLHFVIFFPCVVALYFACPQRFRWMLLLAASYYFYMCWKAEYLLLIIASTVIDYIAALLLDRTKTQQARNTLMGASLAVNLGLLFAFKYFNFFSDSARAVLTHFNVFYDMPTFHVLLPVGISFYTFQTLSYTIDVYKRERPPERHLGYFALYVAFFPQLVAGPIERSERLLPQFHERHRFDLDKAADGVRIMLWGFFKKIVIADRLAIFVNEVFNHPGAYHGGATWLAAYFFSFQIYCDFSGYSDIAIGSAQIMGYRLMDNFKQPYFAENIGDFWQRWHVSLSTWFRDYLYIPLGGNRVSKRRWHINILTTFVVSGLWHGANWTFVIWGALHGLYYVVARWTAPARARACAAVGLGRAPCLHRALRILIIFHLVTFAYIFFRANHLQDAVHFIAALFTPAPGQGLRVILTPTDFTIALASVAFMLGVEWFWPQQDPAHGRSPLADRPPWTRRGFYYAVAMSILIFGKFGNNAFIYFQF